jgi:hypothetical protein
MNEALMRFIGVRTPMAADAAVVYRMLKQQFPQLNEVTTLQFVREPVVYRRDLSEQHIRDSYKPAPGLVAWLQRLRGRIHKWFVDNQYHPGERPVNWKPYVLKIGMYNAAPVMPPVRERLIELQNFGWITYREYPPERHYIQCGYDNVTDTLYIRA